MCTFKVLSHVINLLLNNETCELRHDSDKQTSLLNKETGVAEELKLFSIQGRQPVPKTPS